MRPAIVNHPSPSTQPLRVLQVTPRVAPSVGGVETHVCEVSVRLRQRGIDVTVLTADETRRLTHREVIDEVPLIRARAWPRGRDWFFAPDVPRLIASGPWDLVHVQSYHTLVAPMAMAAAATARIPYVLTFHGGGTSTAHREAMRTAQLRMLRPLLVRAAALVAIADFEIEHYGAVCGIPRGRFVVIPNGADMPPSAVPLAPEGTLIVSSGRLERYKGHHRVIRAMPAVLRAVPDARLWIAGDGPERDALLSLASQLGISDRVEVGAAERGHLRARLATASLAVLLSDFETQPLAVLEAAALHVPVVVADNSGMSELAGKGLARAVPIAAGPQAHAAAMIDELRMPRRAPAFELPTWEGCVERLESLYAAIVERT